MDSTNSINVGLKKLQETVKDREAQCVPQSMVSQKIRHNIATEQQQQHRWKIKGEEALRLSRKEHNKPRKELKLRAQRKTDQVGQGCVSRGQFGWVVPAKRLGVVKRRGGQQAGRKGQVLPVLVAVVRIWALTLPG